MDASLFLWKEICIPERRGIHISLIWIPLFL
jgi:hypothetical protein